MQFGNSYTIGFAAAICILFSSLLTLVSKGFEEQQMLNIQIDKKVNVLRAFGFHDELTSLKSKNDIQAFYSEHVEEIVVNEQGSVIEGLSIDKINPQDDADKLPVYLSKKNGQVEAYAIPISGKGLWSTLYGFFSLENDLNTCRGITFYKHGETPGLGGEVEKPWFQKNFVGKQILKNGELQSIQVIKGKVEEVIQDADKKKHSVDGISGATITSSGVTQFLKRDLKKYEPYFSKLRTGGSVNG